jgi:hypothetical protein
MPDIAIPVLICPDQCRATFCDHSIQISDMAFKAKTTGEGYFVC